MTRRVASWTKKFSIPKGYVTTRNKYMCCEKLYYGYDLRQRRFVTVKATPGNVDLRDVSGLLTRRVLRYGEPQRLHAVFDAGAGKSDADVRALLNRVEVHDASSNAAKCGYDKESPDRKHPRFCRGPLQMIGCLVGLFYNACADFAAELGPAWENVFIRTLRRTFFNQAGKLYCTPTSVIVYFDQELHDQTDLLPMIDRVNAEQHRIPWMNNRLLVLSVCPDGQPRAGP